MKMVQRTMRMLWIAGLAGILSVGLLSACKSNAEPEKTAAVKYTEGSCCAKAAADGKACAHPCCVEATKAGGVCKKCNPS
ncbi:MAG: hypothetical protein WD768_01235 [Phycisphaeraceae bacterium]